MTRTAFALVVFAMLVYATTPAASSARTLTPQQAIDVTYYNIDLRISVMQSYLNGAVEIRAVSKTGNLTTITLDLMSNMVVDSIRRAAESLPYQQGPTSVTIQLQRSYAAGEVIQLTVHYQGRPASTGFGSFEFSSHNSTPWVWTLSEPYGAKDWWPCIDHPLDKADSVDIAVTCRNDLKVASNGRLLSVTPHQDGTHTYRWSERYPIATYLVFVSLTNYAEFSHWYRYSPTDSMQILNYVLPQHLPDAIDSLSRVVDMLQVFSDMFGLYPFINEKYGHAEFGRGGAMEHQTMTSLVRNAYDERALSHELAHQWFGDLITCANWPNLWLNEGFASYAEALYAEKRYGMQRYRERIEDDMAIARTGTGPIYKSDTSNVRQLFDPATVYRKGSAVLHMLRHVVGDTLFFRSLRAYADDARFRYGTATTEDFQHVCESVSGRSLGWFFSQWIYGEGFPLYGLTWSTMPIAQGYNVAIRIAQSNNTISPPFFTMPIDVTLKGVGWDTTVVLFNNANPQTFHVVTLQEPFQVELDPGNWILKGTAVPTSVGNSPARTVHLSQNYPNPFNSRTTIEFSIPTESHVSLRLYDVTGQEIRTLVDDFLRSGGHAVNLDAADLAGGVYFYRLTAGGSNTSKRLTLIK